LKLTDGENSQAMIRATSLAMPTSAAPRTRNNRHNRRTHTSIDELWERSLYLRVGVTTARYPMAQKVTNLSTEEM